MRILIADDNADAADSLGELLRLNGHTVEVVYDGAAALAAFAHFVPQAALLDLGMPQLDGFAAARAIRQLPGGDRALLVAVTGWGQDHDRQRALAAGFDHHTTKPVEVESLQALIDGEPPTR